MATLSVNGVRREVQAPNDTPLLYVLRNELELSSPQFGCGLAQCGSCSVLLDGKEMKPGATGFVRLRAACPAFRTFVALRVPVLCMVN